MDWLSPASVGVLTTIILILALRPAAVASGLIDSPGGRKSHIGHVPVVGGIGMFIGMTAGLWLVPNADSQYLFMLLAAGILIGIGVIDDRKHVSLYARLGAQAAAASVMVYGGNLLITDIGDPFGTGIIGTGSWAYLFTVLVCVSVINAFNFIDGIDGLAGCLALVAIGAVTVVALDMPGSIALAGVVCIASILGFLIFNFPTSLNRQFRTFMGDAGSTLLGIVVL